MTTPFEIAKSLLQTKDDISGDDTFEKDYTPFMVNRIFSMSPNTVLFADAMNKSGNLSKKMQYDFYRLGMPKSKTTTKWIKKDDLQLNKEHIEYVSLTMGLNHNRAVDICTRLGPDVIQAEIDSRGGRQHK